MVDEVAVRGTDLDERIVRAAELAQLDVDAQLTALAAAWARTETRLQQARDLLHDAVSRQPPDSTVDVVLVGSMARMESTNESDFDFLVVVHAMPRVVVSSRNLLIAAEAAAEKLQMPKPGFTGMFGQVVSASQLIDRIGLEQDTNQTHSHRVLLMTESVSIYQPVKHRELINAMLDRYLLDYNEHPKQGVPRFLLNDVLRYWRTLAVDYQAKQWVDRQSGWGLRYLKLLISRKVTVAGTVMSLLRCDSANSSYLVDQFSATPLSRLCAVAEELEQGGDQDALNSLGKVLLTVNEFINDLEDEDFRNLLKGIESKAQAIETPRFEEWRVKARDLQEALEGVFFGKHLKEKSVRYLSF